MIDLMEISEMRREYEIANYYSNLRLQAIDSIRKDMKCSTKKAKSIFNRMESKQRRLKDKNIECQLPF